MPEEFESYKSENLPQFRWQEFFSELAQSRQDQPVNLLQESDFLQADQAGDSAPLTHIEYDPDHGGFFSKEGLLTISTGGPNGETVSMEAPTIVWIHRDLDNSMLGLEIIDEENKSIVMRFA